MNTVGDAGIPGPRPSSRSRVPAPSAQVSETLRITKVFNNNSVAATLPDGREAVLVGPGLGFNKHRNDPVDLEQVEKRFILEATAENEGMASILVSLPYAVVELTSEIAARLHDRYKLLLPSVVEIGLADHLAAALDRLTATTPLFNNLLFETKATYRQEFEMALEVLDWVEELTGRRLPLEEAGFITLHLVNAGLTGNMVETQRTATAVHGVMEIVREWMPKTANLGSSNIERFLTHLKFVIRRLSENAQLSGKHKNLFAMLRNTEPESFDCATSVATYLNQAFGTVLSEEEVLYLMIHLARLQHAGDK